jgi:phosphotransacetylase
MKIVIPELNNPIIKEAINSFPDIEFVSAPDLATATQMVERGDADTIVSGIDYPSRDVLLACKDHISLSSPFFSSCFICQKDHQIFALADGGVNKQPSAEQLYTIIEDTAQTFIKYTGEQPKIALLSYSTNGSGGKNPDLEKYHYCINQIQQNHPDWLIDGEMQLDAAVSPTVAVKKTPNSPIQGQANILITPDLNSGNILYKSLEQFGGFTCAGPIIQGFTKPLADLSRGSTVKDVILTINVMNKLFERN